MLFLSYPNKKCINLYLLCGIIRIGEMCPHTELKCLHNIIQIEIRGMNFLHIDRLRVNNRCAI